MADLDGDVVHRGGLMGSKNRRVPSDPTAAVTGYAAMVGRHRPWLRSAPKTSSFDDLRQLVRRFRPSDLLPTLAALATLGEPDEPGIGALGIYAPDWAIALLARESILRGNEFRDRGVSADDLRKLFNAHSNIYEGNQNGQQGSALAMLTRIAYEQFPYQESIFEEVSRSHALLVEGADQVDLEVLGDDAWGRLLGAPLGSMVGATFFLQVTANKSAGWFDFRWLERTDLEEVFDRWPREVIAQRADQLSSTFDEFKAAYEAAPKPPTGFERYAYNPLTARPFLRMPDGRLLAPQPKLILRTITPSALYYRGMREFGDAFGRDLGHLTEHYVGENLKVVTPDAEVYPEVVYGKKQERKSVDWFLVMPSTAVMFEVKSARYGLLERAAGPGFDNRIKELLNKALGQLERTSRELDSGTTEFEHIPRDRARLGVIVTGEPLYLANSPWMRDLLKTLPFPTLVASLRDIEHLMSLPLDEIEAQLVMIANDPDRSTWSLSTALQPDKLHENVVLRRAWDAYPWLADIEAGTPDGAG
jgi:hypothetical protein